MILFPKPLPEYSSLDEKQQYFAQGNQYYPWIVNTADEFDKLYDRLVDEFNRDFESGTHSLLYRGVNEAKYKTFTSAQRYWLSNDWKDQTLKGFVDYIAGELWNIRKNDTLRHFYQSLNVLPNDFLYLTFLQHFGGAAPMLDLTHSLDMGLFFAIDKAKPATSSGTIDDYISLQLLDYRNYKLLNIVDLVDMFHSGMENAIQMVEDIKAKKPGEDFDCSLIESIDKFTKWHNPQNAGEGLHSIDIGLLDYTNTTPVVDLKGRRLYWSNIRIIAQKGVMLLYTDTELSLEEYILKLKAPQLRCFNIHKSLCDYIAHKLPFGRDKVYPSEEDMAKDANVRALLARRI